jgi:alkylation response protein AidB-like acyl-CoA dehydrogenase
MKGMDISRQDEERLEGVREVIGSIVDPIAKSVPPGGKVAPDQWRKMYRALRPFGYLGSTLPEEFGGSGLSYVQYGLVLHELARGPLLLGEVVPPRTIHYLGSRGQKLAFLPRLLSGDWVSTAAITEPQAGSDLRNLRCTATLTDEGYRVSGFKKWIKLGGDADFMTLMVRTGEDSSGKPSTSRLLVERSVSPWTARELPSVGLDAISFAEIEFEDVLVPSENLLGSAGVAADQFNRGIEASRAFIGIQAVGIADRALGLAIAYARERTAFGRPLARFQAIQASLADAAAKLAAARALCLDALGQLDSGQRAPRAVAMAKLFATETAVEICHLAMDSMGAYGLSREAGVERCWRDCRMLTVIDGTSGIQRLIIGRELLGTAAFT